MTTHHLIAPTNTQTQRQIHARRLSNNTDRCGHTDRYIQTNIHRQTYIDRRTDRQAETYGDMDAQTDTYSESTEKRPRTQIQKDIQTAYVQPCICCASGGASS